MRCPDCNKFVAYDDGEIEVGEAEVGDDGTVTASATLTLGCGECGTGLKSASFELSDLDADVAAHLAERGPHKLTVEAGDGEKTDRQVGAGRYAKTFYGVEVECEVRCEKHPEWEAMATLRDDCQASAMDEC